MHLDSLRSWLAAHPRFLSIAFAACAATTHLSSITTSGAGAGYPGP